MKKPLKSTRHSKNCKGIKPTISVVVPVYNVDKYLPACLDSLLAQTFTDWEAICVDDGSPDKCGEILKKYGKKDKRIKVLTQTNKGVSVARHRAMQCAKGDYICFLDSDDALSPVFMEKMYQLIANSKSDIVACKIQRIAEENPCETEIAQNTNIHTYFQPFEASLLGKLDTYAAIWAKLYKKEVLNGLDFEKEISQAGEDLLYLYQALYRAKTLTMTDEQLYFYRTRPNSVTTNKLSKRFALGNVKTAELLARYFKGKKLSAKARKMLNQKIAKRIFKFTVLEPKRKDRKNLNDWYKVTRPLLIDLKEKGIYCPQHLALKNRLKSWWFLRGGYNA